LDRIFFTDGNNRQFQMDAKKSLFNKLMSSAWLLSLGNRV